MQYTLLSVISRWFQWFHAGFSGFTLVSVVIHDSRALTGGGVG